VTVPLADLTANAALDHPDSACASDPKTHPHSEWLLAPPVSGESANHRPTTVWTSHRRRHDIFPIAPCSPFASIHRRVSSPTNLGARTPAGHEDRTPDTFHAKTGWIPDQTIPDEGFVNEPLEHSCQPGCPG
jgi:hypothetical protein